MRLRWVVSAVAATVGANVVVSLVVVLAGPPKSLTPNAFISMSMPICWLLLWRSITAKRAFWAGGLGAVASPMIGTFLTAAAVSVEGLLSRKSGSMMRLVQFLFGLPVFAPVFTLAVYRHYYILGVAAIAAWCWLVGRVAGSEPPECC